MKSVDRIDINKKFPVPSWVPMLLFVIAISGLLLGRCGHAARDEYIVFFNITVQEATQANIDVTFEAYNRSKVNFEGEGILIRVYDKYGEEAASMITTMDLESGKHNRFLKVLTRITRPINGIEDIGEVTVELYHAGIFK
jgi:hypothetical protein